MSLILGAATLAFGRSSKKSTGQKVGQLDRSALDRRLSAWKLGSPYAESAKGFKHPDFRAYKAQNGNPRYGSGEGQSSNETTKQKQNTTSFDHSANAPRDVEAFTNIGGVEIKTLYLWIVGAGVVVWGLIKFVFKK